MAAVIVSSGRTLSSVHTWLTTRVEVNQALTVKCNAIMH